MRMTARSFLEQSALDYVRTARAKGLPEPAVAWRHVLRNALLPVVTVVGLQIGRHVRRSGAGGDIFSWPGLNTLLG